jgi:type IV pilus assembly protein PilM
MAFFSKKESFIGLDIGTSSIKIVELVRNGKEGISLSTYASAKSSLSLAQSDNGDSVAKVATIAHEMLRRSGASATSTVVALPSLSVFSAVISLPEMNERDLEKAVVLAAKNYVPTPLKDVVLGWTVMKESAAGLKNTTTVESENEKDKSAENKARRQLAHGNFEIFLTAASKDLVQNYSSVVEHLNLNLVALETESFPLSRSLLGSLKEPALLVDIGDLATNFSIVDNGYLRINQGSDIGGDTITKAIVAKLGISEDEAEKRKCKLGLIQDVSNDSLASAAKTVVKDIVERSTNLRRIFERKSNRSVAKTILIGGGANLNGLAEYWSEVSGIPAEVGNPWKGIKVPHVLTNKLLTIGPSFAVAVGLALREFELSE